MFGLVGPLPAAQGVGVVGLAAPGALVASGPQAPSITQHDRVAGAAGEQSCPASEVDDHSGGVEHDPADMPGEGGGEHVVGVDLMPGAGFAAPLINGRRVERVRIALRRAGRGGVRGWFGRR